MTAANAPAWFDRSLYPFADRFLDVDGNRVHYVDEGTGPTLLMLHGNGSWSFLYRHLIRLLSPRFRCVAPDYPGMGLSTARPGYGFTPAEHSAVLERFVAAVGLTDVRLMVQDWGGPIGLGWAGRRPDLIHSLLICNTWAWPAPPHMAVFARIFGSPPGRALIQGVNLVTRVLPPMGTTRKLTPAERRAYTGPYPTWRSRRPLAVLPREILASHDYLAGVEAGLRRLRDKPVELLWGDKDGAFTKAERLRFEAVFPRHRTTILAGAKHYVQEDAPEQIAAAVLAAESDPRIP